MCISVKPLVDMIGLIRSLFIYNFYKYGHSFYFFIQTRMNTYIHLAFVYFNGTKSALQFWVSKDILLINLKRKINKLLRCPENRKVVKLEYHSLSIDNKRKICFTMIELKTNDDLKITWNVFYC